MLAQSASRGGYRVVVLDLFNDQDTQRLAWRSQQVEGRGGGLGGFDAASLLAARAALAPSEVEGIVYGSGFEDDVELLCALRGGERIFGNPPEVVDRLKQPDAFFRLLDELRIPHPDVSFSPPGDAQNWVVKSIGGSGGAHVRPAAQASRDGAARCYFQRWVTGTSYSVSFLANRKRALVLGFNRPWTVALGDWPYCYGGAISRVELPARTAQVITGEIDRLVAASGLVGLNGMDFVLDEGGRHQVIEVNPRPPGTLDLYDADCEQGLFHWHLRACEGDLPERLFIAARIRAHAVVYAPAALTLRPGVAFPDWCSDLPREGERFAARMPVCMVHAEGDDLAQVRALVLERCATASTCLA